MPVTTSTLDDDSEVAPALEAPAGAPMSTVSVSPAGMSESSCAVIFAFDWFVVTAQVAAAVAAVGALPAVAVLMVSEGDPATAIWFTALTWKVTFCVLVWACATEAALRRAI